LLSEQAKNLAGNFILNKFLSFTPQSLSKLPSKRLSSRCSVSVSSKMSDYGSLKMQGSNPFLRHQLHC
jgi:hypothetical protein